MVELLIKVTQAVTVRIQGDDSKAIIEQAAFWQSLPSVCPVCQASLKLVHKTPQKFIYYGLRCSGRIAHEANFGQMKDGGKLFYKGIKSWTEAHKSYQPDHEEEEYPANDHRQ